MVDFFQRLIYNYITSKHMPTKNNIPKLKNKFYNNYKVHGSKLFDLLGNDKYLRYILEGDAYQHNKVLALFCLMRGYKFNNYAEFSFFFSRYSKPAKQLNAFSLERIKSTIQFLLDNKNINFKIGIETIQKYIMDVPYAEDEVIIRLKNGEQVNDVKRLKELEKQDIIYYDNGKWYERN